MWGNLSVLKLKTDFWFEHSPVLYSHNIDSKWNLICLEWMLELCSSILQLAHEDFPLCSNIRTKLQLESRTKGEYYVIFKTITLWTTKKKNSIRAVFWYWVVCRQKLMREVWDCLNMCRGGMVDMFDKGCWRWSQAGEKEDKHIRFMDVVKENIQKFDVSG